MPLNDNKVRLTHVHPGRRDNPTFLSLFQVEGEPHGDIYRQAGVEGPEITLAETFYWAMNIKIKSITKNPTGKRSRNSSIGATASHADIYPD